MLAAHCNVHAVYTIHYIYTRLSTTQVVVLDAVFYNLALISLSHQMTQKGKVDTRQEWSEQWASPCTVCIVHIAVCCLRMELHSVQPAVYSVHCSVCSVQYSVCSMHYGVCIVQCAICSVQVKILYNSISDVRGQQLYPYLEKRCSVRDTMCSAVQRSAVQCSAV